MVAALWRSWLVRMARHEAETAKRLDHLDECVDGCKLEVHDCKLEVTRNGERLDGVQRELDRARTSAHDRMDRAGL